MKIFCAASWGILLSSAVISLSFSAHGYYFETLSGVNPLHRILLFPIFLSAGAASLLICVLLARIFKFGEPSRNSSFLVGWICGLSSLGLILDSLSKWSLFLAPVLAISAALLYWHLSRNIKIR